MTTRIFEEKGRRDKIKKKKEKANKGTKKNE